MRQLLPTPVLLAGAGLLAWGCSTPNEGAVRLAAPNPPQLVAPIGAALAQLPRLEIPDSDGEGSAHVVEVGPNTEYRLPRFHPDPGIDYKIGTYRPHPSIDYKIRIFHPGPAVDFKIRLVEPGSGKRAQPLIKPLDPELRRFGQQPEGDSLSVPEASPEPEPED